MKNFVVIALLIIIVVFVDNISSQSHNMVLGSRGLRDRLLFHQVIAKSGRFLRIVSYDFKYPPAHRNNILINQVVVNDKNKNGNGGYAKFLYGGPNHKNVTIRFNSQRGKGLDFEVFIYGYDRLSNGLILLH